MSSGKSKYLIEAIKKVWRVNKTLLLTSITIRIVLGFIPFFRIWILMQLVNSISKIVAQGYGFNEASFYLGLQVAIMVLQAFSLQMMNIVDDYLEKKVDYVVQKEISQKAAAVPYAYFDNHQFFNHFDRLVGSSGQLLISPVKKLLEVGQQGITLLSYLLYLLSIHWGLTVLSMLTAVPVFFINAKFGSQIFFLYIRQSPTSRLATYYKRLFINRQTAKEVRLFGLKEYFLHRWETLFLENLKQNLRMVRKQAYSKIGLEAFNALAYFGAAGILLGIIRRGTLQIGDFVGVIQTIQGAQSSITSIATSSAGIYKDHLYIRDLFEFLRFEDRSVNEYSGTQPFPHPITQGIACCDVSFRYPNSQNEALTNISFHINPGEKIAIVGDNGSGKTTLVKCLMGLYTIDQGTILFDGCPLSEIDQMSLRDHMTVIFQDFGEYLFTLRENIAIGRISEEHDLDKINNAAEKAGLEPVISSYEEGLETQLGKVLAKGEDLSGGQWQKVALARALFRGGEVFILDEPTAALDPDSEQEVYEHFYQLTKGKTTIFISHRMAAARMADRIFVLKNGQLIEQGKHEELMRLDGEYARMFLMQANMYLEPKKVMA